MAAYTFSMRVDGVTVMKNRRSSDARVKNRILIQVIAPGGAEQPSTTFAFKGTDGESVPMDLLEKELPFGVAFKLVKFEQAFDEHLRIRFHYLQDTKRDWFQSLTGRFIEMALGVAMAGAGIVGVSFDKLLGLDESIKLDEKTYSQKLGTLQVDLAPDSFQQVDGHTLTKTFVLKAHDDVSHYMFGKPGEKPSRRLVVKAGEETAEIRATLALRPLL